jgi:hypothetical protein
MATIIEVQLCKVEMEKYLQLDGKSAKAGDNPSSKHQGSYESKGQSHHHNSHGKDQPDGGKKPSDSRPKGSGSKIFETGKEKKPCMLGQYHLEEDLKGFWQ